MKILFVCLGNICRSSSAEEVMRTFIKREGLESRIEVDSAGILWRYSVINHIRCKKKDLAYTFILP